MPDPETQPLLMSLPPVAELPREAIVEEAAAFYLEDCAIEETEGDDVDHKDWLGDIKALPWMQQPSLFKLGVSLFFYGLALFVGAPLTQVILYKLACQLLTANDVGGTRTCDPIQVQELVTNYEMWNNVLMAVVLLLTVAKVCQLLDIYGRKPFLAVYAASLFVGGSMFYLLVRFTSGMPMLWMWMANVICIIPGGTLGLGALAKSYVTDITEPHERISAMAFAMMAVSLGGLLAPLLSSFLVSMLRRAEPLQPGDTILNAVPRLDLVPLEALLVLLLAVFFGTWFLVPESRSHRSRTKLRAASVLLGRPELRGWGLRDRVVLFLRPLRILGFPDEFRNRHNQHCLGRTRAAVLLLCGAEIASNGIELAAIILVPQFAIFRFHWDSVTLANAGLVTGVATIVVLLVVSPLLTKYVLPFFGAKPLPHVLDQVDLFFISLSALVLAVSLLGVATAPTTVAVVGFMALLKYFALSTTALSLAIVKFFPASRAGELYGGLSLAQSAVSLVTPVVFSQIFTYGVRHGMPGIAFVVLAAASLLVMAATLVARYLVRGTIDP